MTVAVPSAQATRERMWHAALGKMFPIAVVSALLGVPCVWQRHIESYDLATHVYNAWLEHLIATEHLPGLWINHQITNIVFDSLLTWSLVAFGAVAAERLAVYCAVLVFFWGAFAFISVASGKRPWFLLPCLAILAYGRVFFLGFFNFYLSLGFSFFALALLWNPSAWRWVLAVVAIVAACCCHPLGAAWAIVTGAYICIARNSSRRVQGVLFSASVLAVLTVGLFQRLRFPNRSVGPGEGIARQLIAVSGWDQVIAFVRPFSVMSYRAVEIGILAIFAILLVPRLTKDPDFRVSLPVQLYTLTCFALLVLPAKFYLNFVVSLGFIDARISLVAAVLACCVMSGARPAKWHGVALTALAAMYFTLIYQEQRALNRMEAKVTQLVSQLPPRQRVTALLPYEGAEGGDFDAIVDRACVGRCFSYGDYEPGSSLFRIRAAPHNAFVVWTYRDAIDLEHGKYVVQAPDLPLYQIYRCGPAITDLCIRSLRAGEVNGQPPASPRP
jgi:hypothetical protein